MLIFFLLFASALSALHLYNEPKFMVIGNPVILEQSHAHNAPDLWDRGSMYLYVCVVVVVFTLKTVLTSIQYPSLSYSSRQRNEFPWSHANPK